MAVLAPSEATTAVGPGDVITELKTFISRDSVHAGETFKAALRLTIGCGWHINANPASDELLIPTSLEIADKAARFQVLDIVYPEARMARLGFSETDVALYSESALIGVLLRADAGLAPGSYRLKGTVTWQACNDVSCLPPETRDFELKIVITERGQVTKAMNADVFEKIGFGPRPRS